MSFDGFFLHHMTTELREQVLYGRIQKVNQPFERELVLTIRNNRQNYKLLLSAHPVFGRIQTTKADLPNPQNPNTYTMIMRKYLQGAVIEDIQQLENDRVLEISVSNKNEIGDSVKVTLVMEIMGKHSNIILIDKNERKSSNLSSTLVSHKIVTALFCLDLPTSLHRRRMLRILSTFQTKNSLRSYKLRICQLEIFKNFSKVWGVTRPMNCQPYLKLINSRISVPSSIVKLSQT